MSDRAVDQLRALGDVDTAAFDARVEAEATRLIEAIEGGAFDRQRRAIGLEQEFYAVDRETSALRRLPRSVLAAPGFEAELGLHNAELGTAPQPATRRGLTALGAELTAKTAAADALAAEDGIRLVSDGAWAVAPAACAAERYLTEATRENGLRLAINLSNDVRYHGFGAASDGPTINGQVDLPEATITADTAGPASLTTSIQPHYQCRRAAAVPAHLRTAVRIAGPLLAVSVNSPFLPPSLYDDEPAPLAGHAEYRVPVYEGVMNPEDDDRKVRLPRDVSTPAAAIDQIVADPTFVPVSVDTGDRFDDAFSHLRHKHGSYWRWVRPVFEGATERAAHARIEFRPLPGQPTLPDTVSLTAAVAGLLRGVAEHEHPVRELSWTQARENFYAAARDGLEADLVWIAADGTRTRDTDRLYADLFATAADGLALAGFEANAVASVLDPLRERVTRRLTPAGWKRERAAAVLARGGAPTAAIHEAQRAYIDRQAATLFDGHLTDWPAPDTD